MPQSITTRSPILEGLVYVEADMPGWSRVKRGTSFRYRDADGKWLKDVNEISRIRQLAIPPAYTNVWICPLPNGHLQATGVDARGRKQYRYHASWRALKDETKFERLAAFGRALPKIRARVARDLKVVGGGALRREQVLATLVRLLDTTFVRVGNAQYAAANGSYGLTTLRNQHATVRGAALQLRFRGKSGVMQEVGLHDPRVAKVVRRCQQLPGQTLFQYVGEDADPHRVSSSDVNDYLQEAASASFTAKDFRTWHGTVQALELARLACGPVAAALTANKTLQDTPVSANDILRDVSRQLGNTPAVCKKAYVHPAVWAFCSELGSDRTDMDATWRALKGRGISSANRLRAAEARLLAFLSATSTS